MDKVKIDRHSNEWKIIREWAMKRLDKASRKLEMRGVEASRTEYIRGEISVLRAFLAFELETETPVSTLPPHYL